MEIQKNSRQIPSIELYTADKKYNDLLYGILQELSYKEDGERYVTKRDINFSKLGARMNLTRQTTSTKFKNLLALGLVEEVDEGRRFKLNYLDRSVCYLVPFKTLRIINNALSQNCISTYVYLLQRFVFMKGEFVVTVAQIKKFLGVATTTTSNNYLIIDILNVLSLLGLIEFTIVQTEVDKRNIIIKSVRNTIQ